MTEALSKKLDSLPKTPGVYFHKDASGEIIYVGKAARLNNRVRQYFQKSRVRDPKTDALVAEIADTDWIEVESEMEALFLEAEMVRRYMPRFNILLRDDKSNLYVRIDAASEYPSVTFTRRPLDDGAEYYGPFLSGPTIRKALKYLRKIFPYSIHETLPPRACLQYHLGLCPGPETRELNSKEYKKTIYKLVMYLKGERSRLVRRLEKEMHALAKDGKYEEAAVARNQLFALRSLNKQILFSDKESLDLSKDHAIADLKDLLGLKDFPRRIEGYDISHMQGSDTVASMVVFTNGVADKGAYRKFKMRLPGNDDFAHMREVLTRRLGEKHAKDWPRPSLFLIDGGKGQLSSALSVLEEKNVALPAVGLAKQFEEIVVKKDWPHVTVNFDVVRKLQGTVLESEDFWLINLPHSSHVVKLLQRIRDESHRFAVSYHSVLKQKRQVSSLLDEIPGVGPETRKKLLRTFGSYKGIKEAAPSELAKVVGSRKADVLRKYIANS